MPQEMCEGFHPNAADSCINVHIQLLQASWIVQYMHSSRKSYREVGMLDLEILMAMTPLK
jgi:hypothetical protein